LAAALQVNPFLRKSELLDGILAGVDVCGDDADGCKHGHATVVELTVAHLQRVLVQARRVAEISGLLRKVDAKRKKRNRKNIK